MWSHFVLTRLTGFQKAFCRPTTTGNEITVFRIETRLVVVWVSMCVCVCFEKSFIGRQCAWGIKSLMLVLMSQWKCLHSVIYKLHLLCLALPCFAPYCCLVRQWKWPKRDGKKTAVSFSCFSFLSLFLYISHVWYKMSQGILVD